MRNVPRGAWKGPERRCRRVHQLPCGHRGVRPCWPCGDHRMRRLPQAARVQAPIGAGALQRLSREGARAHASEPGACRLHEMPRRRRASPREGSGLRDLPHEGARQRTGRTSHLHELPRGPLRQEQARSHVRELPRRRSSEQARERSGRLSELPPAARPERRCHGAVVRLLSHAREAPRAACSEGTCRLHAMPFLPRTATRGAGHVHEERLPHGADEPSARGADVQWLPRLQEVTRVLGSNEPGAREQAPRQK